MAALLAATLLPCSEPHAQQTKTAKRIWYKSDRSIEDIRKKTVTLHGNVEVWSGIHTLMADRVIWYQKRHLIVAEGKVIYLDRSGHTVFASRIELTDDLKKYVVKDLRMLLSDGSKAAAKSGVTDIGKQKRLRKVIFSPCKICKDAPNSPPLWRIKAQTLIHDEAQKKFIYKNAWLEVFGVPIIYTPYYKHPDPTVDRATGWLSWSYGVDSKLGYFVQMPYYFVFNDREDLTLTPMVSLKERVALFAEYRRQFDKGGLVVSGSYNFARRRDENNNPISGSETRGHLFAKFRYDLDDNWRVGANIFRASDKTYLRLYDISTAESLKSRVWAERFSDRSYLNVEGWSFQGLRAGDDEKTTPAVYPNIEFDTWGKPYRDLGRWRASAYTRWLSRDEGADSYRLSGRVGWRLPDTHFGGQVVDAVANLWGDFYYSRDLGLSNGQVYDGSATRFYPEFQVNWRYPFVKQLGNYQLVVAPRASLISVPVSLSQDKIPNEDSLSAELDQSSLFAIQPRSGRDRVETGTRVAYGLNVSLNSTRPWSAEAFLGQSLQLDRTVVADRVLGIRQGLSDIVGMLRVQASRYGSAIYRFQYNIQENTLSRSQFGFQVGVPEFRLSGVYDYFTTFRSDPITEAHQIRLGARSQVTSTWTVFGGALYDLRGNGLLEWQSGVEYRNECCRVRLSYQRYKFEDQSIGNRERFFLQIDLKYIGTVTKWKQ
ncbi:MAG: LPS assembly protein LptD [Bauldia litoralis]